MDVNVKVNNNACSKTQENFKHEIISV